MHRQTKIVATLGPASSGPRMLEGLIQSGLDVARINFSHGTADQHRELAMLVRKQAEKAGRQVALLCDLQGPKIRVGQFRKGHVDLVQGAGFTLDVDLAEGDGDDTVVGVTYRQLPGDVAAGDTLVLADGLILLDVEAVEGARIQTRVKVGGRLSNGKGINRQGGGLSAGALTDKDRRDICLAAELGADYMAVSFPKTADDMDEARGLLRDAGGEGALVAKIERAEAVENLSGIMDASDAVMVARGDLAVEIGDAELPGVQKKIIRMAREQDCVTIVATEMMESMIENPRPTRAEVLDVANAVLDGADAVMLSGETAVGRYPVKVLRAMDRVCRGAENQWKDLAEAVERRGFGSRNEAIAKAAMYTANHLRVKALVAMTESGATVLWMSRIRSDLPVYALTSRSRTARRVNLYRGVHPVQITWDAEQSRDPDGSAMAVLQDIGAVEPGDNIILTRGDEHGVQGGTNTLKILTVSDEETAPSLDD